MQIVYSSLNTFLVSKISQNLLIMIRTRYMPINKTDFRSVFNCSCLSQKWSYWVATSKSRRLVDQMMNASNPLFTVNTKRKTTCTSSLHIF